MLLFAVSYYRNCYRRGYRIDIWHSQLFLSCVLPNMIMLPFSKSELNAPVVGHDFAAVVAALPGIFLISLVVTSPYWLEVLRGAFILASECTNWQSSYWMLFPNVL